jgi:2-keto-3-deoxy-L-rhamnonate aldolase RhmA
MAAIKLGKPLKDKMLRGETVFGTFIQTTVNPAIVDFLPDNALDFVIVSAEHNALDLADFLPLRYALAAKGIACLARTHSRDQQYVTGQRCVDTVFVPMIESLAGVENLDAICAIPGVHAVFIGPNDLTTSMGIPNEYDHPDLIAMIQRIIDTAQRRHVAAGCWFGKPDQAARTIRQGGKFVVYSNDANLLRDAMDLAFTQLRKG